MVLFDPFNRALADTNSVVAWKKSIQELKCVYLDEQVRDGANPGRRKLRIGPVLGYTSR